jgi:hypothetical protein
VALVAGHCRGRGGDRVFQDGDGCVGLAGLPVADSGLLVEGTQVVVVQVDGCSWLADVRVVAEDACGLVEQAEASPVLAEAGVAACLLLQGQRGELTVDRSLGPGGSGGELDDCCMVLSEDGDVGLADEHIGGHLAVVSAMRPFGGAAGPVSGGAQVAAVLQEPADCLAVLGHDLEQRLGVWRAGAAAQVVQNVELGQDGADEPSGAEHLVRRVVLIQGTAEVGDDLTVDPGGLVERVGEPVRVVRAGGAGQCC